MIARTDDVTVVTTDELPAGVARIWSPTDRILILAATPDEIAIVR